LYTEIKYYSGHRKESHQAQSSKFPSTFLFGIVWPFADFRLWSRQFSIVFPAISTPGNCFYVEVNFHALSICTDVSSLKILFCDWQDVTSVFFEKLFQIIFRKNKKEIFKFFSKSTNCVLLILH
jgi:hypothetical protein